MSISDEKLSQFYQDLEPDLPHTTTDEAILKLAHHKAMRAKTLRPKHQRPAWYWGTGLVASALMVAVLLHDQGEVLYSPAPTTSSEPESKIVAAKRMKMAAEPTIKNDELAQSEDSFVVSEAMTADSLQLVSQGPIEQEKEMKLVTRNHDLDTQFLDELLQQIHEVESSKRAISLASENLAQLSDKAIESTTPQQKLFNYLSDYLQKNPTTDIPEKYWKVLTEEQKQALKKVE